MDPNKAILEQCNNLRYDVKFEFSRKKVNLIRTIGEGAFGQVWMATAEGMESFKPREAKKPRSVLRRLSTRNMKKTIVAVKCLKGYGFSYLVRITFSTVIGALIILTTQKYYFLVNVNPCKRAP